MLSKDVNASTIPASDLWTLDKAGSLKESFLKEIYKRVKGLLFFLFAFGLGACFMYLYNGFSSGSSHTVIQPSSAATHLYLQPEKPEFSRENLFNEIVAQGIICPNVVFAQAELESAFLTAGSSVKTNNLFGMRYPGVRKTTAVGLYLQGKDSIIYGNRSDLRPFLKKPTYAVYEHWTDAVKDYKLWQDYSFKTRSKYIEFLSRVYATEPTYAERIREMVEK
jgi:hypothetical protein